MKLPIRLHTVYIRNTQKKAIVQMVNVLLTHLTTAVVKGLELPCNKAYLNTRVLKHIYDKRPAEEYDFVIHNIAETVKYPDKVYKNKNGKRGEFCFVKDLKNSKILVSLEIVEGTDDEKATSQYEVATCFRINNDAYLANYELLWEWKGGDPSS